MVEALHIEEEEEKEECGEETRCVMGLSSYYSIACNQHCHHSEETEEGLEF